MLIHAHTHTHIWEFDWLHLIPTNLSLATHIHGSNQHKHEKKSSMIEHQMSSNSDWICLALGISLSEFVFALASCFILLIPSL